MEIKNKEISKIEIEIKLSRKELREIEKNAKSQIQWFKHEIKNLKLISKQAKYCCHEEFNLRLGIPELNTFETILSELCQDQVLEQLKTYRSENNIPR